jgi:hypothetical protein
MKNSFKWYIIATMIIMMIGGMLGTGIMETVWHADVTKISFLILAIFGISSFKCGSDIYKYETTNNVHKREVEIGWFAAETLLALGMTGTVIGFIIIMKDFMYIDVQDVASIEAMIKSLGSGISTALYTTLFGLVTSMLLKVQYFLLEDMMEKEDEEV